MRVLREPLVHFVALGALLFVVYALTADRGDEVDEARVITIENALLDTLRTRLEAAHDRPVSDDELNAAVDAWLRTEVLARAAEARGFAAADPVVRAHLARKMAYLLDAAHVPPDTPPDDALRALFESERERFRLTTQITVRQIFVADHTVESLARAEELLARLLADEDPLAVASDGDDPPGGPVLRGRSPERLEEQLGVEFAEGLEIQPLGDWTLRRSPGGWHIVRVEDRRLGRQLEFDEARNRVLTRWRASETEAAVARAFEALRAEFDVVGWPR